ncbi:unnamed protein product [Gongylonema pulchrum]|uniref:PH domain-containing protein n=1 Tax=Gongylonema pulchrum TaxID=637853 RepID=A0A183CW94_9BILA|nr:unnamed protein product [Gongylonema pulchrum]
MFCVAMRWALRSGFCCKLLSVANLRLLQSGCCWRLVSVGKGACCKLMKFVQNSPIYMSAVNELLHADDTFISVHNAQQSSILYCCNVTFLILKAAHRMVLWQNKFLRQGWLCKWTKRGFLPHIVLLFNDAFLIAHRSQPGDFRRNAFLPLRTMTVDEGDAFHVVSDPSTCITIHLANHTFLLSGNCTRVRDLWYEELTKAIQDAKRCKFEDLPQTEIFGNKTKT